jgi:hypothetical protein
VGNIKILPISWNQTNPRWNGKNLNYFRLKLIGIILLISYLEFLEKAACLSG